MEVSMTTDESWKELRSAYYELQLGLARTHIVTLLAEHLLDKFPHNLPQSVKVALGDWFRSAESFARQRLSNGESEREPHAQQGDSTNVIPFPTHDAKAIESLSGAIFHLILIRGSAYPAKSRPQDLFEETFGRTLLAQELVMVLAYFEAFITDATAAIYRARPDALAPDRKIDVRTLLGLGSWESLIEFLANDAASGMGKTLLDRIQRLGEYLKIGPLATDAEMLILQYIVQVRHAVVHSGGCVTSEFLKRTGLTDLLPGQPIPLSLDLVSEASGMLGAIAGRLVWKVSGEIYDKSPMEDVGYFVGKVPWDGEDESVEG